MIVRLFRRGGSCGYNDGCASTPKAVGNRLACALRAAGYQNSLAGEFIRGRGWFDQCIHFVSSDDIHDAKDIHVELLLDLLALSGFKQAIETKACVVNQRVNAPKTRNARRDCLLNARAV